MEKETVRSIILAAAVITLFCTGILSQSSAGSEHETVLKLKTYPHVSVKNTLSTEQLNKITKSYNLTAMVQKKPDFLIPFNAERPELKIRIEDIKFSRLHIPEKKFEINLKIVF